MTEQELIKKLEDEGYKPVYVWKAEPNEEDSNHAHDFDTHLEVIDQEIEIGMNGVRKAFHKGESINIPRNVTHWGKAGPRGCTYVVAERHPF